MVVPLIGEQGIVVGLCRSVTTANVVDWNWLTRGLSYLVGWFGVFNFGRFRQRLHSTLQILLLVEVDDVP